MSLRFWTYLLAFFDDTWMKKIDIVHVMYMKYEGTASKQLASLWWLTTFRAAAVSAKGQVHHSMQICFFYGLFFVKSDRKQGGSVCNQSCVDVQACSDSDKHTQ